MSNCVVILDLGGGEADTAARLLRGSEYLALTINSPKQINTLEAEPKGIIIAGNEKGQEAEKSILKALECGLPVLSFGSASLQVMYALGGEAENIVREGAVYPVALGNDILFSGIDSADRYFSTTLKALLPAGCEETASCDNGAAAFISPSKNLRALFFDIESNDPDSISILKNFAAHICGAVNDWSLINNVMPNAVAEINNKTPGNHAIVAVSGGVDSSLCAVIAKQAIGEKAHALYIETGLTGENEGEKLKELFFSMGIDINIINARERFFNALDMVNDPIEKKLKIHGVFAQILEEEKQKYGEGTSIIRGTIYTDLPEDHIDQINGMNPIEPIRLLLKSEVRALAQYLNVPEELVNRHSFPACGYALRIVGIVTEEKIEAVRTCDAIFRRELTEANILRRLRHSFTVLTDIKDPTGKHTLVLRALASHGDKNAVSYRMPFDLLERVTDEIIKNVPLVGRVFYDLTPTLLDEIEWQ